MKIKNKTGLRRELKSRLGSVGMWDYVLIDRQSGEWSIVSSSTTSPGCIRVGISAFVAERGGNLDQDITRNLEEIEKGKYEK